MSLPTPSTTDDSPTSGEDKPGIPVQTIGYLQRAYASSLGWYKTAETKAQLLLTVNGIFVTIIASMLARSPNDLKVLAGTFGPDTWTFLSICFTAVVGAVVSATGSLWSVHGSGTKKEFASLAIEPGDPSSYRPEVFWYFGHLAYLQSGPGAAQLRAADEDFEAAALSFNIFPLARNVLRKHRLVNLGWAFTGLVVLSLLGVGVSLLMRAS